MNSIIKLLFVPLSVGFALMVAFRALMLLIAPGNDLLGWTVALAASIVCGLIARRTMRQDADRGYRTLR